MPDQGSTEWTVATLKQHYDQRFGDTATAVQAALAAAEKAVAKAEIAAEKRFELLNELRAGVATTEQLEALEKVVNEIKTRLDTRDGRGNGLNAGWIYLLGAATLVSILITIILFFNR